jgi:hypothetical protein
VTRHEEEPRRIVANIRIFSTRKANLVDAARIAALADELGFGALPHAVVDLDGLVDVAKERLSAYEHGAIA